MNLEQLGYKALHVYYKDNIKIIVNADGIEKQIDGKPTMFTWDEFHALSGMKPSEPEKPKLTESNPAQPKLTEKKGTEPKAGKKRGPKKRVYNVVNKWTGETVCKGLTSSEAYKEMGLSSVNKFRLILNDQKNGKHHAKWDIKEQAL